MGASWSKDCPAVKNHGIDKKLVEAVFEENKKFFALPKEEKMKIAAGNVKQYRWRLEGGKIQDRAYIYLCLLLAATKYTALHLFLQSWKPFFFMCRGYTAMQV